MKKISAILSVCAFASAMLVFPTKVEAIEISAASAVLIEAESGRVVFGKNENEFRAMASTTKIMTTLLCLESGDIDEEFEVDSEAIKVEGSSMGLTEGDTVTKRALCIGMLLPSGNDAANAAAIKLAGSYDAFAKMMNRRADEIGMENTHFVTPSGLDAEGHGSTAYDMALLAGEALENPDFAEICSQQNIQLSYGKPPYQRWLKNTNKLLGMYDGCIGVKTGFTDEAGRCLVSAVERDGVRLICVTLKAPDDWNDHIKMYDYGFSVVKSHKVDYPDSAKKIPLVGGECDVMTLRSSGDGRLSLFDGEKQKIKVKVIVPKFVYAPVKKDDKIGEIRYYLGNDLICSEELYAGEGYDIRLAEKPKTLTEKIKERLEK